MTSFEFDRLDVLQVMNSMNSAEGVLFKVHMIKDQRVVIHAYMDAWSIIHTAFTGSLLPGSICLKCGISLEDFRKFLPVNRHADLDKLIKDEIIIKID
jgi:hypothetical protein